MDIERLKALAFSLAAEVNRTGALLVTDAAIEITKLRARMAEAEKIIKPFADLASHKDYIGESDDLWCSVRLRLCRAAAEFLKGGKP